jgi:DNA-binding XRE family transcriptional regulator
MTPSLLGKANKAQTTDAIGIFQQRGVSCYCWNMPTPDAASWTIRAPEDFGRAIADLRRERGLTQAELASQSGLSRNYLALLETGVTAEMLERVLRLLRRLGAEVTVSFEPGKNA